MESMNTSINAQFFDIAGNDDEYTIIATLAQRNDTDACENKILPKHKMTVKNTFVNVDTDSEGDGAGSHAASAPELSMPVLPPSIFRNATKKTATRIHTGVPSLLTIQECESMRIEILREMPLDRIPAEVSLRMMREDLGLPPDEENSAKAMCTEK